MKKGFTLAEVLITLGIIGVVAAMTIPTLITNYNDRVLETQKTKTRSIFANAFKLMMANENVTDLALTPMASCGTDSDCYSAEFRKVFKVLADVTDTSNNADTEYSFTNGNSEVWSQDKLYTFVLNDGTVVGLENTSGIASGNISLVVDLNGFKSPNIGARDLCRYVVSNNAIVGEQCSAMASLPEDSSGGNSTTTCDAGFYMSENGECVVNDVENCELQTQSGICLRCANGLHTFYINANSVVCVGSGGSVN